MDISSTFWWLGAGLLVAAELLTGVGVVYLLMIALGFAAGALAAHAGAAVGTQVVWAAVVAALSVGAWHQLKGRVLRPANQAAQDALHGIDNPDLGATVQVTQWDADGSAQIKYRGSIWRAQQHETSETPPAAGTWRIAAVQGSVLLLEPV